MANKRAPLFMRPMTAVVLAALAGASFVLALWLGAYGGDLGRGHDPGAHALSHSAIGYAGLVQLLKLEGTPVSLAETEQRPPAGGLLVLTPRAELDKAALARVTASGRVLLILPKWQGAPDPLHAGWIKGHELNFIGSYGALTALGAKNFQLNLEAHQSFWNLSWRPDAPVADTGSSWDTPNVDRFQTFDPKGGTGAPVDSDDDDDGAPAPAAKASPPTGPPDILPVLTDNKGRIVVGQLRGRDIFLLSEPDLVNNQGLKTPQGAAVASGIVTGLARGGPVVFDLTLGGPPVAGRNSLKLLFEPPLASASLCLLFAALLTALQAFVRFGPVAREGRALDFSKASLVESAATLLASARREPRIAPQYLELVAAATARSIGLPLSLDGPQRDAELDRLSGLRALTPLSHLAAAARGLKTRSALMAWAHQVYQWSEEMTRGRR